MQSGVINEICNSALQSSQINNQKRLWKHRWIKSANASPKKILAHCEVGSSSSSSIRNRSVCRWNKRENFPAPLQEILTGFLVVYVVLYVVVVCVDNARPLFFAKSFYKLHHRRHTDTAASKLSTGSKQIINNNEFEKMKCPTF